MITSGSPKERENEQQDAGQSQSSCSIWDACSAEPTNSVTVRYAGGLNRPRSLSVASETAGAPGASDPPEPFVCRDALLAAGHRNAAIEWRWAEGQYDRLPALIADLVHSKVKVIAATGTSAALPAKAAITTIPIVFTTAADPVQLGLVGSLGRPGGNVTGSTQLNVEVAPKRLELLHEVIPTATAVAVLLNPSNPNGELTWRRLQPAAGVLGIKLHRLHVSSDFAAVFATLLQMRADALVISPDSLFTSRAEELAALALRHRVPAIYQYPEFTAAGGLMSYGGSIWGSYHQAGVYVGRILKGEKPADLPVQQSTKVELIINLKTARALGLTVPPTLLALANEVIE